MNKRNKMEINEWVENIRNYEPLVADYIQKYIDDHNHQLNDGKDLEHPAILWLKARRSVYAHQYSAVATFAATPFRRD